VGHTWSLCIEEQFYLLWPPLLLLLKPRWAFKVIVVWIMITPLVRELMGVLLPGVKLYYNTLSRIDGLLAGCAVALMASGVLGWRLRPVRRLPWLWLVLAWSTLFVLREY